jgi:hypothetical protein
MNPFQHGEVFVTDDGAETDLDVGHYERFLDTDLHGSANVTTGQVYSDGHREGATRRVPRRHGPGDPAHHQRDQVAHPAHGRRPDAPRPTSSSPRSAARSATSSRCPSSRRPARVRHDLGRDNVFFLHVSLVPYLAPSGELKTKPTQHSVAALRNRSASSRTRSSARRSRDPRGHQAQDLPDVRCRHRGGGGGGRCPEHLRHPQGPAPRGPRRLCHPPARVELPRCRLDRLGRHAAPGPPARAHRGPSPSSASTSTCRTPICR